VTRRPAPGWCRLALVAAVAFGLGMASSSAGLYLHAVHAAAARQARPAAPEVTAT
jgi:hypothetical protein